MNIACRSNDHSAHTQLTVNVFVKAGSNDRCCNVSY